MWLIWGLVVALMVAGSSLVALPRRSPVQLTALPAGIFSGYGSPCHPERQRRIFQCGPKRSNAALSRASLSSG